MDPVVAMISSPSRTLSAMDSAGALQLLFLEFFWCLLSVVALGGGLCGGHNTSSSSI